MSPLDMQQKKTWPEKSFLCFGTRHNYTEVPVECCRNSLIQNQVAKLIFGSKGLSFSVHLWLQLAAFMQAGIRQQWWGRGGGGERGQGGGGGRKKRAGGVKTEPQGGDRWSEREVRETNRINREKWERTRERDGWRGMNWVAEAALTRLNSLWSINGLGINSKTIPDSY